MKSINSFRGENRFLSNFWLAPVSFEGVVYPSTEHAYQAAKTSDTHQRVQFTYGTPRQAKRLGRTLLIRDDWEAIKAQVMYDLVWAKFAGHSARAE